ncbi:LysR family transcriptional regulator [Actinoallomurus rhizosphaericola]|uniref:LysR family transcriptional regulator n=1 Tax=Actinoallomurus rhizosphaericola TaxID=2952536 RepID=UPI0020904B2D|nr:LysR family transcriptional regulator [Actinoallomurus rhizosphaericola]MCO5994494.1 LysR family transcriptional regulator [Actinoallomurus rhizosphaericola]
MLDLERLRALNAVATYGSVSAAAEVLHVTTSAVSQQVAKLERETGQKLLERNGRGVRLTDAAALLAAHAERILAMVEAAESDLEAHRGAAVGELAVAAFPTAARGLMPRALSLLAKEHPRLTVTLREQEPHASVPLAARGEIDLGIVQDWFNVPLAIPDGLVKAPLLDDVADVALPFDHPLADRKVIDLADLRGETWIAQSVGAICRDWLEHTLRTAGLEPRISHTADEYATQLALVASGLGSAVLPRLGRCDVPPGVRIVQVRPALNRHVYGIWRAEAARRPAIRAAVAALRAAAADVDV